MSFNLKHRVLLIGIILIFTMTIFILPISASSEGCAAMPGTFTPPEEDLGQSYSLSGNYIFEAGEVIRYSYTPDPDSTSEPDDLKIVIGSITVISNFNIASPISGSYTIPSSGSYSVYLYAEDDTLAGTDSATIECVTTKELAEESSPVFPPDNRINWQYGDMYAVVYPHEDGVVVYCWDGEASSLGMYVNQAVVDSWDKSQADDIPVLSVDKGDCRAAFYIHANGEYQLNIWSPEGKIYEMLADNIVFVDANLSYYDPNE